MDLDSRGSAQIVSNGDESKSSEDVQTVIKSSIDEYLKSNPRPCEPFMCVKRLNKDAIELEDEPVPGVDVGQINNNIYEWAAVFEGPVGSLYEGGTFFVEMKIPKNYPISAPKVFMKTRIFHPNVKDGRLRMALLTNWTAINTMRDVLESIKKVFLVFDLSDERYVSPTKELYLKNREEFEETARLWTKRFSCMEHQ